MQKPVDPAIAERRNAARSIAGKIAALPPEKRAELAAQVTCIPTIEGHVLTLVNTMMIVGQREGCTMVGGYRQWRQAGRQVRKGEHAIYIWTPKPQGKSEGKTEGAPENHRAESRDQRFLLVPVFDIEQTDVAQDEDTSIAKTVA